jgi:hypothetical protein
MPGSDHPAVAKISADREHEEDDHDEPEDGTPGEMGGVRSRTGGTSG